MPKKTKLNLCWSIRTLPALLLLCAASAVAERAPKLEEVIVTAQKREESLQQAPIAIAVLGAEQLQSLGVSSLADLSSGIVPSLRVQSSFEAQGALAIAIRGAGVTDNTPINRETPVGVYQDGIFLARPQGLAMELADVERIEVLRGPQGTLFGRNTTGGAVSIISRKPGSDFAFEQTLGGGNYNALTSVTRVNLPELAGVRSKFSYIHSERDGWIENDAPGQADYGDAENDGGMFSLSWTPIEALTIDYHFDKSRVLSTSNYYQFYIDNGGLVGEERDRASHTRHPMPLDDSVTRQTGHALIAAWEVSEFLTIRSLTGYRRLEESAYTNYDAVVYSDGFIFDVASNQNQRSQELQFIGTQERINWVAGLYYFKGYGREKVDTLFSLDTTGALTGIPNAPIVPPTNFMPSAGIEVPRQVVKANTKSEAVYGQFTWTPPILADKLHLTVGGRYTEDDKDGSRADEFTSLPYDLETDHWDSLVTLDYNWTEALSTYLKRSTGYRSGSVNRRSLEFTTYDPEEVTTWELGLKSEFWDRRLRLNMGVFQNEYEDMQFDFGNPNDATATETANAAKNVKVKGFELELTAAPMEGLLLGVAYTYLDDDMPIQPNPLGGPDVVVYLTQTPRHAGSFTADYTFAPTRYGTVVAHFDATAASQARFFSDTPRADGYELFNARLSLKDIPLGGADNRLAVSVWGKNLADEEYVATAFALGDLMTAQSFGDPRTYGVDVTYRYR